MKIEKFSVKACCGKTAVAFRINKTITKDFLASLVAKGFIEAKHFTAAGILFAENQSIIVNGPFGSDILNIKCKVSNCTRFIDDFEALLATME